MSGSSRSIWNRTAGIIVGILVVGLVALALNVGFRSWWSGEQQQLVDRDKIEPRDRAGERRARQEAHDRKLPKPYVDDFRRYGVLPPPPAPDRESLRIDRDFVIGKPLQPIVRVPPDYPTHCASYKGGEAVIEFVVDPDGSTADLKVVSATSECLARAAIRAVARWKYRPMIRAGRAVRSGPLRTKIEFAVEDSGATDAGSADEDVSPAAAEEPEKVSGGKQPGDGQ